MKNRNTELLAPAGSISSLKAAVNAGADAVYIGGGLFGARAYADNPDEESLLKAIDYVHLHNRKIYLTINTLLKEKELTGQLYNYLKPYYEQGIDAVIVQDVGVLRFIREYFPDLPVHASTQMTITGRYGAKLLEDMGADRIVTSRELSLHEIKDIHSHTNIEIESFVHGALCYCYSGQCLFSSLIGGRSGNRGRCAQPCRLPYDIIQKEKVLNDRDGKYVLSPKDMCTLEILPQVIEAGVYSLKIEGRMKKAEYTAGVVGIYRKYLDLLERKGADGYHVEEEDLRLLMDLYNRGGFSTGYYKQKNGKEMLSLRKPNHFGVKVGSVLRKNKNVLQIKALQDINQNDVLEIPLKGNNQVYEWNAQSFVKKGVTFEIVVKQEGLNIETGVFRTRNNVLLEEIGRRYLSDDLKEKINGKVIISQNLPVIIELQYGEVKVILEGNPPEEAKNQPLKEEQVVKQIKKTGNTAFEFESLQVELNGNVYVSIQELNNLRREALNLLEAEILKPFRRIRKELPQFTIKEESRNRDVPKIHCYIESLDYLHNLLSIGEVSSIYLDSSCISLEDLKRYSAETHARDKEIYLALPYIFRKETAESFRRQIESLRNSGVDGFLIRNYEEYQFLKEYGLEQKIIPDYNVYTFNQYAKEAWNELGATHTTLPLELNYKELLQRNCTNEEMIVYGYIPMMVTAQCIQKTAGSCSGCGTEMELRDRYENLFPVRNYCKYCYNVIYNSRPLSLLGAAPEVKKLAPGMVRLNFTIEKPQEVQEITERFISVYRYGNEDIAETGSFTRGHFKRGVE